MVTICKSRRCKIGQGNRRMGSVHHVGITSKDNCANDVNLNVTQNEKYEDMPKILLWAVPRTLSTAFERMVMEIPGKSRIYHEPFSAAYNLGPDRSVHDYDAQLATKYKKYAQITYKQVIDQLTDLRLGRNINIDGNNNNENDIKTNGTSSTSINFVFAKSIAKNIFPKWDDNYYKYLIGTALNTSHCKFIKSIPP